jgi:hypothetical protein
MVKDTKIKIANTLGITAAIGWVLCSVFVAITPKLSMDILQLWFHGLDIQQLGVKTVTLGSFILGGVTFIIASWFTGYVLGLVWEKLSK